VSRTSSSPHDDLGVTLPLDLLFAFLVLFRLLPLAEELDRLAFVLIDTPAPFPLLIRISAGGFSVQTAPGLHQPIPVRIA